MMNSLHSPVAQLVGGLLIAAAVGVAFVIGDDAGSGLVSAAIVAAFVHHVGSTNAMTPAPAEVQDEPDTTLNVLCAVFGVTWVAAAIVLPRRG